MPDRITRRVALAGALASAGTISEQLAAQSGKRVRLAGTNLLSSASIYVAKQLGYFADEGLDADILESSSGNASVSSMIAGSVDAAVTGHVIPWQLAEKGLRVKSLVGIMMKSNYVFVLRSDIPVQTDDPAALVSALKGRRFGVSNLGSVGDTIASGVLSDFGAQPSDFVKVAVGVGATALAALKSGGIHGLVTYEPDLTQILKTGIGRIALDLRSTRKVTSFTRLPTTTLQATSPWIQRNPDVAARMVRAVARANRTLQNDPRTSIAALSVIYKGVDPAEVQSMYDGERSGFRSTLPLEEFEFAQDLFLRVKAISKSFRYEELTAVEFAALWS